MRHVKLKSLIEYESVTDKYLKTIMEYKEKAKKKLISMGFKVKEIENGMAFEIRGGDISKLHLNYISTEHRGNKIIINGSEFESIAGMLK